MCCRHRAWRRCRRTTGRPPRRGSDDARRGAGPAGAGAARAAARIDRSGSSCCTPLSARSGEAWATSGRRSRAVHRSLIRRRWRGTRRREPTGATVPSSTDSRPLPPARTPDGRRRTNCRSGPPSIRRRRLLPALTDRRRRRPLRTSPRRHPQPWPACRCCPAAGSPDGGRGSADRIPAPACCDERGPGGRPTARRCRPPRRCR